MNIAIIGAGPIGSYTGYLLAKKGHQVKIYEEHPEIGEPVQCSGIITQEIYKIMNIPEGIIINKYKKVKVHSKHKATELKNNDLLIDRKKFDQWIAKKAKKAGAQIYLSHKYLKTEGKEIIINNHKKIIRVKPDKIIHANGPQTKKFLTGIQARIKGKFKANQYQVYLGSISPGFFAWIMPESNEIARIGLAGKKVSEKFEKFIKNKGKIIEKQAGIIPIYEKPKIQRKNEYYIGDAANQVKATTGGGIVPGLKAAKKLATNIHKYPKAIKKINRDLWTHKQIRKILNQFTDKDYDTLIKLIDNTKIKKILAKNNRDKPIKLIIKLLITEPKFLKFGRKILKNKKITINTRV